MSWFVLCEPHAEATGLDQSEFNSLGRAIAEKLYKRRLLIILHFPLLSLKNQLGQGCRKHTISKVKIFY